MARFGRRSRPPRPAVDRGSGTPGPDRPSPRPAPGSIDGRRLVPLTLAAGSGEGVVLRDGAGTVLVPSDSGLAAPGVCYADLVGTAFHPGFAALTPGVPVPAVIRQRRSSGPATVALEVVGIGALGVLGFVPAGLVATLAEALPTVQHRGESLSASYALVVRVPGGVDRGRVVAVAAGFRLEVTVAGDEPAAGRRCAPVTRWPAAGRHRRPRSGR